MREDVDQSFLRDAVPLAVAAPALAFIAYRHPAVYSRFFAFPLVAGIIASFRGRRTTWD